MKVGRYVWKHTYYYIMKIYWRRWVIQNLQLKQLMKLQKRDIQYQSTLFFIM